MLKRLAVILLILLLIVIVFPKNQLPSIETYATEEVIPWGFEMMGIVKYHAEGITGKGGESCHT